MSTYPVPVRRDLPTNAALHPFVYRAIIGLTIWLVLSAWALFSRGTYEGLTLSVITFFFLILVGIPVLLWRTWQHNAGLHDQLDHDEPFNEWASSSFATWTGAISGWEAATQILLPIAAVAIGMTIFGLTYLFAVPHAGS